MNRHIQTASELIGMIYDCVLDPDRWTRVLEACRHRINFHYAALSLQSLPAGTPLLHACSGLSPEWLAKLPEFSADFIDRWGGRAKIFALPLSEPAILSQVNPGWACKESRYWREWAEPLGICDIMALGMLREPNAIGSIILARHRRHGPIDSDTMEVARLILPHAQRAIAISRVLESRNLALDGFWDAMDHLGLAVLSLGANRTILQVSRTARELLADSPVLTSRNNRLSLGRHELDRRLDDLIAATCQGLVPGADMSLRDAEGRGYLIQILPVSQSARIIETTSSATLVLIRPLSARLSAPPSSVAAMYGLTPAEAAVLAKIAQGNGVVNAAQLLGSSVATVKTHLQRIFDKTGVRRQADLVALVSSSCRLSKS